MRFSLFLSAALLFVPVILLSDGAGFPRQLALATATTLFLVLFARRSEVPTRHILCAIAVATLGEAILSIAWGLYTYRFALLPLYVPVGHGLFYALAAETAIQPVMRRHAARITRLALVSGSTIAAASLAIYGDTWGLLWWIAAAILIARSRNPLLMSIAFFYTTFLEWTGTAIGNWRWAAEVPYVGLHSANPPSGVGILYVVLDLLVVMICSRWETSQLVAEETRC